jgi:GNAT superfamily N-acetyltransferase
MSVEIRPVETTAERKEFLNFPYRLYANESIWVAPLKFERARHIDPKHNPFFEHAEVQLFLAYRDGRVVGRISAHVDDNLNEFQGNKWGLFGFFECEDDAEAATALIDAAAEWNRERGRDRIVGPMSFSTNDECGLLIEGYELTPIILTEWHFPYYRKLLEEACGLRKAMDTLMWDLHISGKADVHPAIWEMAGKVETEHGIICRPMRKKELQAEVGRFLEVYNEAWERNWGFVPLNEKEARAYADNLKFVLDENWAMIAEKADTGEVVGAALTLPDFNQAIKAAGNGRLLPFGWLKILRARKKIDRVRVFALGVKREYQHAGVAARLYEMHYESAESTPQGGGETGWILETNKAMNRGMEGMGGTVTRRYRFYERLLVEGAEPSLPDADAFPWRADTSHSGANEATLAADDA